MRRPPKPKHFSSSQVLLKCSPSRASSSTNERGPLPLLASSSGSKWRSSWYCERDWLARQAITAGPAARAARAARALAPLSHALSTPG
eukprot:scaffold70233_cov63-Phaeocystis_antarctica.AAC.3